MNRRETGGDLGADAVWWSVVSFGARSAANPPVFATPKPGFARPYLLTCYLTCTTGWGSSTRLPGTHWQVRTGPESRA